MKALALTLMLVAPVAATAAPIVEEQSIADLSAAMASGKASSEALTRAYLTRIER